MFRCEWTRLYIGLQGEILGRTARPTQPNSLPLYISTTGGMKREGRRVQRSPYWCSSWHAPGGSRVVGSRLK